MKRAKGKKICILCFASLLAALIFFAILLTYPRSKAFICRYVRQNQETLTDFAEEVMQSGPGQVLKYDGWSVSYFNVVVFQVSYWGIAPSSTEKGFYYSPDGTPQCVGDADASMAFVPEGDGWLGVDGWGNTQYTENICGCWYWYELRL